MVPDLVPAVGVARGADGLEHRHLVREPGPVLRDSDHRRGALAGARPVDAGREAGRVRRDVHRRDRGAVRGGVEVHRPGLRDLRLRAGAVHHDPLERPVIPPAGPERDVRPVPDPGQLGEPLEHLVVREVVAVVGAFVQGGALLARGPERDREGTADLRHAALHDLLPDRAQRHPDVAEALGHHLDLSRGRQADRLLRRQVTAGEDRADAAAGERRRRPGLSGGEVDDRAGDPCVEGPVRLLPRHRDGHPPRLPPQRVQAEQLPLPDRHRELLDAVQGDLPPALGREVEPSSSSPVHRADQVSDPRHCATPTCHTSKRLPGQPSPPPLWCRQPGPDRPSI